MLSLLLLSGLIASFIGSTVCAPTNPSVRVNLRVEGLTDTIFEGLVLTKGHNITTASGGTHHCDGTNNHANPTPGATCTSALDTASKKKHFQFDGTFDASFDDYFITSIGDSTETATQFWGLLLDFQFTPVGGCQQEVKAGQQVLWAFDAFNKVNFLKATGPAVAVVGKAATYTVVDGSTGNPIEGATIGGATTDANGKAIVKFKKAGVQKLKAEASDSIRSNAVETHVV